MALPDGNTQLGQDGSAALDAASLSTQGMQPVGEQADFTATEQAALRAELIKGHPNAVHEMISGRSTAEMIASVSNAEAAFHRVHAQIAAATPTAGGGAGGVQNREQAGFASVDVSKLSPLEKISMGMTQTNYSPETHGMGRVNDNRR